MKLPKSRVLASDESVERGKRKGVIRWIGDEEKEGQRKAKKDSAVSGSP